MKKTYLGLMGLFLLPQTALAVDAAAPASTSVSSPLAALWRVLLTPITVPYLPWQLPLLAPVALVLVLLRGNYAYKAISQYGFSRIQK